MPSDKPDDRKITIFCGSLQAKLHLDLFNCPGIHEKCIEFKEDLISPREFCKIASKSGLIRDWKGTIRVGNKSLRYTMEQGIIDFTNHAKECSNRCQSRNHIHKNEQITAEHVEDDSSLLEKTFKEAKEIPMTQAKDYTKKLGPMDSDPIRFWTELRKKNLMKEMLETMKNAVTKLGEGDLNSAALVLTKLTRVLKLEKTLVEKVQKRQCEEINLEDTESDEIEITGNIFLPGPRSKRPRIWLFKGQDDE